MRVLLQVLSALLLLPSLIAAQLHHTSNRQDQHSNLAKRIYQPDAYNSNSNNNGQPQLLGHLRKRRDFLLGLSLKSNELSAIEHLCVVQNMNLLVPDYELKWDNVQRDGPNSWDWSGPDKLFRWARIHGKLVRGHTGLWKKSTPGWVNELSHNRTLMEDAIYKWVYATVARYGSRMVAYDVVNEPMMEGPSGDISDSVYWQTLGYGMFQVAYRAAAQARKDYRSKVKLYLNEYNVEGYNVQQNTNKRPGFLKLLADLKKLQVPIDGIGLQLHARSDLFPWDLEKGMAIYTNMGYEVSITEVDIRIPKNDYSSQTLQLQAKQFAYIYETCLKNMKCAGVIRWALDDSASWIPKYYDDGFDRATMFGAGCTQKPIIMNAVINVLNRY